ncbi:MAG: hypothetical protein ACXW53_10885 [Candidatus Binatia bacterium]
MALRDCSHICKYSSLTLAIARRISGSFAGFGYEIILAYFVLFLSSAMNRQHVKTFLAALLASMLLYYNAAWAVLRCCHVDEHGSIEEILSADDLHDGLYRHLSRPSQVPSQIDCLDFDYQTEIFTGPASPPQFHRGTAALTPRANDIFDLRSLVDGNRDHFLRKSFTRGSPAAEPSDPPLYLSLSNLRI